MTVTIDNSDQVYVVVAASAQPKVLSFDDCLDAIDRYATELMVETPEVARGTLTAWKVMDGLRAALEVRHQRSGEQAVADLSPQLVGLEGWRVNVEDEHGEVRSFVVGTTEGWMPRHVELPDDRPPREAQREYKRVTPIARP